MGTRLTLMLLQTQIISEYKLFIVLFYGQHGQSAMCCSFCGKVQRFIYMSQSTILLLETTIICNEYVFIHYIYILNYPSKAH